MKRSGDMTMAEAAKALGMGRSQLFQLLRERRHFHAGNVPDLALRQAGYFRTETRGFIHPTTQKEMAYQRVVVTARGLTWLWSLIREERANQAAPSVGAGNRRVANAGGAPGRAGSGAGAAAAAGERPSDVVVGTPPAGEA